jgi:hypothetical protein
MLDCASAFSLMQASCKPDAHSSLQRTTIGSYESDDLETLPQRLVETCTGQ